MPDYSYLVKEFQKNSDNITAMCDEIIQLDTADFKLIKQLIQEKSQEMFMIYERLEPTKVFADKLSKDFSEIDEKLARVRFFANTIINGTCAFSDTEIFELDKLLKKK